MFSLFGWVERDMCGINAGLVMAGSLDYGARTCLGIECVFERLGSFYYFQLCADVILLFVFS